ncbi:hypothetical protein NLG97_g7157 [Lecanicillium saksenae]|uniref:Uncharacterized protein n=1 Tax=Lecanicillium saksenae TaxID=468837 RepID=A0ACC1QQT3_9HYPO|nr:hypothetical protein NLG97_g7157 [Lecanicillium saksenae]
MKSTFAVVACLATAAFASPIQVREEQTDEAFPNILDDLVKGGVGLVTGGFDAALCVGNAFTGGLFGGKTKDKCSGKGDASVQPPPPKTGAPPPPSTHYTYNYNTNKEGKLEVDVSLDNGQKCHYTVDAQGKEPKAEITKVAKQCIAEKGNK